MTFITKMSISPAKPLSNRAAEFAFKFYKLFSMLFAVFGRDRTAFRAYQLGGIELGGASSGIIIHHFSTVFPATKIRLFALIALKISIYGHPIFQRFFVILRVFISDLGIIQ